MGSTVGRLVGDYNDEDDNDIGLGVEMELARQAQAADLAIEIPPNAAALPAAASPLLFGGNIFPNADPSDPVQELMLPLLRRLASNTPALSHTKTVTCPFNINKASIKLVPRITTLSSTPSSTLYDIQFTFDTTAPCIIKMFYSVDETFSHGSFTYLNASDGTKVGTVPHSLESRPQGSADASSSPISLKYVERRVGVGLGQTFFTLGEEALDVTKFLMSSLTWNQLEEQLEADKAHARKDEEDSDNENGDEADGSDGDAAAAAESVNEQEAPQSSRRRSRRRRDHRSPSNSDGEDNGEALGRSIATAATAATELDERTSSPAAALEQDSDDDEEPLMLGSNDVDREGEGAEEEDGQDAQEATSSNETEESRRNRRRSRRQSERRRRKHKKDKKKKRLPAMPRPKEDVPRIVRNLYPLIISVEPIMDEELALEKNGHVVEAQITQVCFYMTPLKDDNAEGNAKDSEASSSSSGNSRLNPRVLRQKLLVNGSVYNVYEIFGVDQQAIEDPVLGADLGSTSCVICMSEPRTTLVVPCRHMCLCEGCAETLKVQSVKCPICRGPVRSLLKIEIDEQSQNDDKNPENPSNPTSSLVSNEDSESEDDDDDVHASLVKTAK